jgi:hypothetical protein
MTTTTTTSDPPIINNSVSSITSSDHSFVIQNASFNKYNTVATTPSTASRRPRTGKATECTFPTLTSNYTHSNINVNSRVRHRYINTRTTTATTATTKNISSIISRTTRNTTAY